MQPSNPAAANTYDEFPYLGRAFNYTHPDRLCAHAALHGLKPMPVERCRVLELGCGEGGNLLPMAYGLPGSQFLGIDLAATPMARGNARARELGLSNVRLEALDILDFPDDAGPFDYIIAHGIYSWVPLAVREKMMALCGAQLAPHGVAYISYQTQPGSYRSTIVHEMMRFQASRHPGATPEEVVRAGLEMLRLVVGSKTEPDFYRAFLEIELRDLEARAAMPGGYSFVYHDIGVEVSEPVTFYRVMEQAGRHALRFLSELRPEAPDFRRYTPAAVERLESLGGDVLAREQYQDFFADNNFRRTLFCRADAPVDHATPPERVYPLHVAATLQPANDDADTTPGDPLANEDFITPRGPKITVNQPVVKEAFRRLERAWPASIPFAELVGEDAPDESAARGLATILLSLYHADLIALTTGPARAAASAGERPVASAFVRWQIAQDLPNVATLAHGEVEITAPPLRRFLTLLDGTRDRAAILRDWQAWLETARAADPSLPTPEELEQSMDAVLQRCVRLQLLVEPGIS